MPSFVPRYWLLSVVTVLVLVGAGGIGVVAIARASARQGSQSFTPDRVQPTPTPRATPGAPDQTALDNWRRFGGISYEVTETVTCRCPGSGRPVTLVVLQRKAALQPAGRPPLLSIDALFDRVYSHRDARFTATYDLDLGYPTRIQFDPRLNVTGDEVTYELTSYQPK
jgi:hypothetical protein